MKHQFPYSFGPIVEAVAFFYEIPVASVKGRGREQHVALARHVAMYLMRRMTNAGLLTIGRYFGRDHSTVIHAERRVRGLIITSPDVRAQVECLEKLLRPKVRRRSVGAFGAYEEAACA